MEKIEQPQTPYEILGDAGIKKLAAAFYDVMDEMEEAQEVRAMHAESLDHIKRMLAAYLTGWMGGPPVYQAIKGTVCLTDPHEPFRIGPKERDQWLRCMDAALLRIEAGEELIEMLKKPMYQVAETIRNCDDSTPKNQGANIIAVS
ncbi:MAG: hemoglobin [Candidatus Azotimanducaceae bacterium]|jgi:hemoglobin